MALTDFRFLLAIYYSLHAKVHSCSKLSLQSRHNFGERVFSVFLRKTLIAIFIYYSSGSGEEKEIFIKGVNDGQKKIEGRGRGHRNYSNLFLHPPSPHPLPLTVHTKSNMVDRINNHDLVTS